MWYIYMMEYYLAIKKNKIMPFAPTKAEIRLVKVLCYLTLVFERFPRSYCRKVIVLVRREVKRRGIRTKKR